MAEGMKNIAKLQMRRHLRIVETGDDIPLAELTDEAVMLAHGRGSQEAFAELLRRHQKGVLNYLYRMVQNRHVAEELTQEVFLALVKSAQRYQPTAKFTTYLYRIASNIAAKEWTRAKRRLKPFSLSASWGWRKGASDEFQCIEEQIEDQKANVVAAFQRGEISEAVNAALKHLPEAQREAFVLRRFEGMSLEEIAQITNAPIGTVKSRVSRAERSLRPYLDKFREYV